MPIAFDASSSGSTGASANSLTYAHTTAGSDRILLVGVRVNGDPNDVITGITYSGIAMTRIAMVARPGGSSIYLYYLIAPATSANNIIISCSAVRDIIGVSASYTGTKQSAQPDASDTTLVDPAATSITSTMTTIVNGSWGVSICGTDGLNDLVPGANVASERVTVSDDISLGDSNAAIIPPGSFSQTWTFASQTAFMIMASIAPSVVPTLPGGLLGAEI